MNALIPLLAEEGADQMLLLKNMGHTGWAQFEIIFGALARGGAVPHFCSSIVFAKSSSAAIGITITTGRRRAKARPRKPAATEGTKGPAVRGTRIGRSIPPWPRPADCRPCGMKRRRRRALIMQESRTITRKSASNLALAFVLLPEGKTRRHVRAVRFLPRSG